MADLAPADVTLSSIDGRLKVLFQWRTDRFAQRLFVDDIEVGHSVEGDGETAWPASPPIQQLSRERIADRDVVLGVGGAGRGHWSISVEPIADGTSALKFDLACRGGGDDRSLGSQYELGAGLAMTAIDGELSDASVVPTKGDGVTRQWSYRIGLA